MKKLVLLFTLGGMLLSSAYCSSYRTSRNANTNAPGQVKKAYGAKNAKAFAPGQQKKKKNKRNKN